MTKHPVFQFRGNSSLTAPLSMCLRFEYICKLINIKKTSFIKQKWDNILIKQKYISLGTSSYLIYNHRSNTKKISKYIVDTVGRIYSNEHEYQHLSNNLPLHHRLHTDLFQYKSAFRMNMTHWKITYEIKNMTQKKK